jgi:hypothetical protein
VAFFGQREQAGCGPTQVDGGGAGLIEQCFGAAQVGDEGARRGRPALLGGQRHAVGPRRADGGRPAHDHVGDAKGDAFDRIERDDLFLQGQDPLVDHGDLIVLPVDGAHGVFSCGRRCPVGGPQ